MSIWTVKPEVVTVDLVYVEPVSGESYPFWIRFKKSLTVGEERRVTTAGWGGVSSQRADTNKAPEINIDWRVQSFMRSLTYLTDWSLEDDEHRKLPITQDGVEALPPDVYAMIEEALNTHVEAQAQEKKARSGASSPSPTSV